VNTTQTHPAHSSRRLLQVVIIATALAMGTALPAGARTDPGLHLPTFDTYDHCLLERVGTQYVKCDELTGNGVPAPAWVRGR
jgi:hypothetical protein